MSERTSDWDMTPYFPEFDGREYRAFRDELERDISSLQQESGSLAALTVGIASPHQVNPRPLESA